VLSAIDLPFSAVADTLFLPCDIIACVLEPRRKPIEKDE
jgi:uncharacterized protein YceK